MARPGTQAQGVVTGKVAFLTRKNTRRETLFAARADTASSLPAVPPQGPDAGGNSDNGKEELRMKCVRLVLMAGAAAVLVGAAGAQDTTITDSRAWLGQYQQQQQPPVPPRSIDPARQAVRDRIAAVQQIAAQTVTFSRGGRWHGNLGTPNDQPFSVEVQHNKNDGRIAGRVILAGSQLLSAGKIAGHVSGSAVSGVVTDDNGSQVATFTGAVSAAGAGGTYEAANGDTGTWSYDNPPPAAGTP